jgi:hypothetical protein
MVLPSLKPPISIPGFNGCPPNSGEARLYTASVKTPGAGRLRLSLVLKSC